jgi:hypothetical protein
METLTPAQLANYRIQLGRLSPTSLQGVYNSALEECRFDGADRDRHCARPEHRAVPAPAPVGDVIVQCARWCLRYPLALGDHLKTGHL